MHPAIEKELEAISADRTHGAAQLAERGLGVLERACTSAEEMGEEEALAQIASLAERIRSLRPSMAAPGNWAVAFWEGLTYRLHHEKAARIGEAGEATAQALRARGAAHLEKMAEAAHPLLKNKGSLLTLSDSSTIEALILRAAGPGCRIFVAESRPLCEGRELARRLLDAGHRALCITDAQIGAFMREAETLLLGADTICADLAAVNKSGSLLAALAARRLEVPCVVAADTFKLNPSTRSDEIPLEEGPGSEVWAERPEASRNVYFETIPSDLITCFITEKGMLSHAGMRGELVIWKERLEKFGEAI